MLAANRAARALFTDWDARPHADRNLLRFLFGDPRARYVYVEWEREAAAQLAQFRAASAHRRTSPDVVDLVEWLRETSTEAARWWDEPDVAPLSSGAKLLRHEAIGEVRLEHLVLTDAAAPDQKFVTFRTPSGDDTV